MLKSILWFLFPKTINEIMREADIIYQYGSIEAYHQQMDEMVKNAIEEEEYYQREQE